MEEYISSNFIHDAIDKDLAEGVYNKVQTRFPPEPNGYLHIGHVKAINIDFSTAKKYGGTCNLRLDDTNPTKEDVEYVDAIMEDIKWLGFEWDNVYYASDYFPVIYDCAIKLIKKGLAYVDDLTAEEIREYRGTLKEPGKESPYRNRSVEENLDLFERMTNGEFETGSKVLRAKIDMAAGNINMRDPVIYRVLHATHHRTGDKWCVYPMYDFAHPISDTAEGVTHSLCSLEFEDHRPLYDWFLKACDFETPSRQIEFARLNLTNTLTSKRKCLKLVKEAIVDGWDDPRMSTICGMRRKGYPAEALLDFADRIGVAKSFSVVDYQMLEHCVRENLNLKAPRAMAVLHPLKVTIENYPEGVSEKLTVEINPNDETAGTKEITFSKNIYIEQDDFMEVPVKGYKRLTPDNEVRLKGAYFIKVKEIIKGKDGEVTELICTYDPASKGGNSPDGRKVKGTIQWVDANNCIEAAVNMYDKLFLTENPGDVDEYLDNLNPKSLDVLYGCKIDADLANAKVGDSFQFMRNGYFTVDKYSTPDNIIFNLTATLKDSFKMPTQK
ncbi:MAG: glutamine--tRNA ligase/YqeY domain fusion protein [Clostridia bacterium]|nr:glutamine--tRNA ligase/YqeY domain fusion protein [Clostridia bacterium]